MPIAHSCIVLPLFVWALLVSVGPIGVESLIDHPHTKRSPNVHKLPTGLLQRQEQPSPTTVSHESWFQRLGNAFTSVVVGLFGVIPFSVAFLWINEKRNAQLESLISLAEGEAETLETDQKELADYDGALVHMNKDIAKGLDPLRDKDFPDVNFPSGCIKLMTVVEVYQWKETVQHVKKKDSVGGGQTTENKYSYKEEWSTSIIDSSKFYDKEGHTNTVAVQGLRADIREEINHKVKYGESHWVPKDLVKQMSNYTNAKQTIGKELKFRNYVFQPRGEYYEFPARDGSPQNGDFRVKVQYVLDGPATILALQMEAANQEDCHTFGPYRTVSRGCCGISGNELKQRRLSAAKMDADELYQQDKCWEFGPFFCLCSCCNLVMYGFTHIQNASIMSTVGSSTFTLTPQIFRMWPGVMSVKECVTAEKASATMKKWIMRLVGWLLLWIGFTMLFRPLEVVADIIPFIGPYLGTGIAWVVGFLTFLLTVCLSTCIVSLAYLIYRPLIGMMYLALSVCLFVGICYMGQLIKNKEQLQ